MSNYHVYIGAMSRFYHSSIEVIENLSIDDFNKYFANMENAINEMEK